MSEYNRRSTMSALRAGLIVSVALTLTAAIAGGAFAAQAVRQSSPPTSTPPSLGNATSSEGSQGAAAPAGDSAASLKKQLGNAKTGGSPPALDGAAGSPRDAEATKRLQQQMQSQTQKGFKGDERSKAVGQPQTAGPSAGPKSMDATRQGSAADQAAKMQQMQQQQKQLQQKTTDTQQQKLQQQQLQQQQKASDAQAAKLQQMQQKQSDAQAQKMQQQMQQAQQKMQQQQQKTQQMQQQMQQKQADAQQQKLQQMQQQMQQQKMGGAASR
jgi:flagellar biosynthesis GTPase FlhF